MMTRGEITETNMCLPRFPDYFQSHILAFSSNLDDSNPDLAEWRTDIGRVVKRSVVQVRNPTNTFFFFFWAVCADVGVYTIQCISIATLTLLGSNRSVCLRVGGQKAFLGDQINPSLNCPNHQHYTKTQYNSFAAFGAVYC